jgi:hypothetical protein
MRFLMILTVSGSHQLVDTAFLLKGWLAPPLRSTPLSLDSAG